jgi:putative DNA primase/helicase
MNQPNTHKKTGEGRPGQSQNNQRFQSHSDIVTEFIDAMHAAGLRTDAAIIPDGVLHRFRVEGDKQGTLNGFYVLHTDGVPSGAFGSWKAGINQTWCAKSRNEMTSAERQAQQHRINEARRAAVAELEQRHRAAAERAAFIWSKAKPAQADHPYLVRKAIAPGIARQKDELLVLPVTDVEGNMRSLQFIQPDGSKRLLSGGAKAGNFIMVQSPEKPTRTMIAEGWATAQTLAEIEPQARVIASVDAGNMLRVALALRTKHPDADIVIAMDFDEVGRAKGIEAAQASRAQILPVPENVPEWVTDWNDLRAFQRGASL